MTEMLEHSSKSRQTDFIMKFLRNKKHFPNIADARIKSHRTLSTLMLLLLCVAITGCADKMMVPGGDKQVNEQIFSGKQDLLNRIAKVQEGMSQNHVFSIFDVEEKDLVKIGREDIMRALFGDNRIPMSELGHQDPVALRNFLRELYGYTFQYQDIKRSHGFKDVIRYRTKEKGFDYDVTLIFHNGALFEKPVLTGGAVKKAHSISIFDSIRYGTFIPGL